MKRAAKRLNAPRKHRNERRQHKVMTVSMNSTIITAVAAVCGSLVGAAASIATTWITQRTQTAYAEREEKLRHRETLYGEFINSLPRLRA